MRWITLIIIYGLLPACAWFHPGVVHHREVIVTDPPNKLLEPFTCGDQSIDVSTTTKKCKTCKTKTK